MARNGIILLWVGIVAIFMCSGSHADVPQMINYQGKLTTATGGCLNDTVQMTFTIYADSLGDTAKWSETQDEVVVKEGVFSVLLGSMNPIPDTVFDGSTKYLGVQVESDPEMRPLKPMVSVGYAFHSGIADTAYFSMPDADWVIDGDNVYHLNGHVGIGTTSPAYRLDVFGQNVIANFGDDPVALRLGGDADAYIGGYATGGGKPTIYLGSNSYYTTSGWVQPDPTRNSALFILQDGNFAFRNGGPGDPLGSEKMSMDGSGNVGIGTISPDQKLGVNGMLGIYANTWIQPSTRGLFLYHEGTSANIYAYNYPAADSDPLGLGGKNITLTTYSGGNNYPRLYVQNDGKVGIGTTSPSAKLDVRGDQYVSSDLTVDGLIDVQTTTGSEIIGHGGAFLNVTNSGGVALQTPDASSIVLLTNNINRMEITEAGNVGIGTTAPDQKLGVNGIIGVYPEAWVPPSSRGLFLYHNGACGRIYAYNYPGGEGDSLGLAGEDITLSTYSEVGTLNPRLYVHNNGNVGIGTTSPGAKLDVEGNAQVIGSTDYPHPLLRVTNSGQGQGMLVRTSSTTGGIAAIEAQATENTGNTYGVYGITNSNSSTSSGSGSAAGVYGIANYSGSGGDAFGVLGVCKTSGGDGSPPNDFAAGVYGQSHSSITDGKTAGVFGEGWSSNPNGAGVVGKNNSATGSTRGVWGEVNSPNGAGVYGRNASSADGSTGGRFESATHGTVDIAHWEGGTFYAIKGPGTKSCVVSTSKGKRTLFASESPEVWFEDFGEGELKNGYAHIDLDGLFLETVTISEEYPMKVFVQLNDDCNGVYVKRGNTGFDVYELNNGKNNAHFTYRIVAKRKGYENKRLEKVEQELSSK